MGMLRAGGVSFLALSPGVCARSFWLTVCSRGELGSVKRLVVVHFKFALHDLLDLLKILEFFSITKGPGDSRGSRPSGTPDPVNITLRFMREVIIDDMGNVIDVDPAGDDVGGEDPEEDHQE